MTSSPQFEKEFICTCCNVTSAETVLPIERMSSNIVYEYPYVVRVRSTKDGKIIEKNLGFIHKGCALYISRTELLFQGIYKITRVFAYKDEQLKNIDVREMPIRYLGHLQNIEVFSPFITDIGCYNIRKIKKDGVMTFKALVN